VRRDLAAVGSVLVLAGVVVTLRPGLVPDPAALTPRRLAGVAVLAALLGVATVVRSPSGGDPDTEGQPAEAPRRPPDLPTIGDSFDTALDQIEMLSTPRLRRSDGPAYLRDRLRRAAVVTVAREEGIDHERAAALIDEGTWTDDPAAAAFLSDDVEAPLGLRLREALSTSPRAVLRARRTAAVLEGRS